MKKVLFITLVALIGFNALAQDIPSTFNPAIGQEWNNEGNLILVIDNSNSEPGVYIALSHRGVVDDPDEIIHPIGNQIRINLDKDLNFTAGSLGIGCYVPVMNETGTIIYERYMIDQRYYRKKKTRALILMKN